MRVISLIFYLLLPPSAPAMLASTLFLTHKAHSSLRAFEWAALSAQDTGP